MVLLPPGEIYTALERGTLDATEFVGPHDDLKLGFQNAARYYYYPGWHEPTSIAEFSFNKKAYDALPAEFRHVLNYATDAIYGLSDAEYFAKNAVAMQRLTTEFKTKVELVKLPDAVIDAARKLSAQVMQEEADRSPHGQEGGGLLREVPGPDRGVGQGRGRLLQRPELAPLDGDARPGATARAAPRPTPPGAEREPSRAGMGRDWP